MKKLINKTLPLVLLFSAILFSCGKQSLKKDATVKPTDDLEVGYEWQKATGEVEEGTGTGKVDIKDGEQVTYTITPKNGCCNGKYSFKKPEGMSGIIDADTGVFVVKIKGAAKWVFTIICTCPDGSVHRATITIDAK